MAKMFVGPQLRQLRRKNRETQARMAERLGISPAYVALLETNQRALSVSVLMALSDQYGVDIRSLVPDGDAHRLAELRAAVRDPMFGQETPDIDELRAARDHAPLLVTRFLDLYKSHRTLVEQVERLTGRNSASAFARISPETVVHDFFRMRNNHFPTLEDAAETLRLRLGGAPDDMYALLKAELRRRHGVETRLQPVKRMADSLRDFDAGAGWVDLSEALDHPNRIFQLCFTLGLLEAQDRIETLVSESGFSGGTETARLRVELTNYLAAAIMMPYDGIFALAEDTGYDIDRIAATTGASFEQVCQRLTTLQRDGARGVPLFFLRVDRAGNVSKRFNASPFTLAEQGGACPVWDIHGAFRLPGTVIPQCVELPDGGRFFTISRTTDRPVFSHDTQDRRLVVALGCEIAHAGKLVYARRFNLEDPQLFAPIGLNCHVCPRQRCSQRAHRPMHVSLPLDAHRRGRTRFES